MTCFPLLEMMTSCIFIILIITVMYIINSLIHALKFKSSTISLINRLLYSIPVIINYFMICS